MKPQRANSRFRFERSVPASDAYGDAQKTVWEPRASVWAVARPRFGREVTEQERVSNRARYTITCDTLAVAAVRVDDRAIVLGGHGFPLNTVLAVVGIVPVDRHKTDIILEQGAAA